MAPVLVAGLESFLDEQAAESRAIDEEIAGNAPAILQVQRLDEAGFGVLVHFDDLPFDAHRAALFGVAAQIGRVEAGVELEGVIDASAASGA